MLKKPPTYNQECSAALDLLRAWQTIPENSAVGKDAVREVVERYANGMWYQFGTTLFEHLSVAAKRQNIWTISGPSNPALTLEIFLNRTCSVKNPVTMVELRAEFNEIAAEIKRDYGEEIRWQHELHPLKNIKAAKEKRVALWMEKRLKQIKHA